MSISKKTAKKAEVRCLKCGKLLAKHDLHRNILEIKCMRCGTFCREFFIKNGVSHKVKKKPLTKNK